ncbi:MAG: heme-degrading domain-containing protein [Ruminococcus flavefaciens]|nr:heme-degrading domain-containing protein [Ruminococcus flavefaciens]
MEGLEARIEALKAAQKTWEFPFFDEGTAWEIGSRIREKAKAGALPVAISVTWNRRRLFYSSMPGAAAINDQWVRRKENTVYQFQKSSYEVALYLELKHDTMEGRYGLDAADYAAAGGSVPLLISGMGMVGAITVSGLSQQEDHELVTGVILEYLGGLEADKGREA